MQKLHLIALGAGLLIGPALEQLQAGQKIRTPLRSIRTPTPSIRTPAQSIRRPLPSIRSRSSSIRTPARSIRTPTSNIRAREPAIRTPLPPIRTPLPSIRAGARKIRVEDRTFSPRIPTDRPALTVVPGTYGYQYGYMLPREGSYKLLDRKKNPMDRKSIRLRDLGEIDHRRSYRLSELSVNPASKSGKTTRR
ncbi:MAG: hypothetical protein AAF492_21705 [Verrucomicrobiota bacterium]